MRILHYVDQKIVYKAIKSIHFMYYRVYLKIKVLPDMLSEGIEIVISLSTWMIFFLIVPNFLFWMHATSRV